MTARALRATLVAGALASALLLWSSASPAAAHGIVISAVLDSGGDPLAARLELTDETGEICLALDRDTHASAQAMIETLDGTLVVELGSGFGSAERCQFLDVESVDSVLADVDQHQLTILDPETGNTISGQLTKPPAPSPVGIESSAPEGSASSGPDGPNVPLIFGVGAALGVGIAVIRKRRR
jgi:hypothetical protein